MCYNISNNNHDEAKLQKILGSVYPKELGQIKLRFSASGFTHPHWPVITQEKPGEFQNYVWGLIPAWTQGEDLAKKFRSNNLNAKCETIFDKPSFRVPIKKHRCLVPVTGFFEWRDVNKKKYPYFIYLKEEEIFCLGGIYDEWVNKETGEIFHTFSIITTEANPLMARIHNLKLRMPLIIPRENLRRWLDPELSEERIKELMRPMDENCMAAHTISKRITSRTENPNSPETILPFHYPELESIKED